MSPFGQGFPEQLQAVLNHAERFAVALTLAENDQSLALAGASREMTLGELWVVGRAGEVTSFVQDVVCDWHLDVLPTNGAAAVIESYLRALHRSMRDHTSLGGASCCASAHECVTVDFCTPHELIAQSYPRELLAARLSNLLTARQVPDVRIGEAPARKPVDATRRLSRLAQTVEVRL